MKHRKSRLSWHRQEQLINYFVAGSTARCASELVGIHRNSAILYFRRLREIISYELEKESDEYFCGEIEVDESYFGGTRKGKRGRGAKAKTPVFGLLKRGGKVYMKIIPNANSKNLIPTIEQKFIPIVNILGVEAYNFFTNLLCHCRQREKSLL